MRTFEFSAKILVVSSLVFLTTINCSAGSLVDHESSGGNRIIAGTWSIAPIISTIASGVSTPETPNDTRALISWNTDIPSTTNVEWRTNAADPWTLVLPEDIESHNTVHFKTIQGLFPLTNYYFRVKSKSGYGNETVSAQQYFKTGRIRLGDIHAYSDIIINEFLPNPAGDDNAAMPEGEWVELFNRSYVDSYDLSGWYLTDYDPSHRLSVTMQNAILSGSSTASLTVKPQEFMVVYRNKNTLFSLNNDNAGDQVNLYDSNDRLIDSQDYNGGLNDSVIENKSFARFPDGSDYWFDPVATPGKPNKL